jgi:hypothetical protein
MMLERVRRCLHCGREIEGSPLAYRENPYCSSCLSERLKALNAKPTGFRISGSYVDAVRNDCRLLSSDGGRE